MKFAFIDEEKATWPVVAMCDVLAVSRSGFYAWKARPVSARTLEDVKLVVDIKAAHKAGRGAYGSPRVFRALREQGKRVGKKVTHRPATYSPARSVSATRVRGGRDGKEHDMRRGSAMAAVERGAGAEGSRGARCERRERVSLRAA